MKMLSTSRCDAFLKHLLLKYKVIARIANSDSEEAKGKVINCTLWRTRWDRQWHWWTAARPAHGASSYNPTQWFAERSNWDHHIIGWFTRIDSVSLSSLVVFTYLTAVDYCGEVDTESSRIVSTLYNRKDQSCFTWRSSTGWWRSTIFASPDWRSHDHHWLRLRELFRAQRGRARII